MFALISLTSSVRTSHAQGGYPGGGSSGHWNFSLTLAGGYTGSDTYQNASSISLDSDLRNGPTTASGSGQASINNYRMGTAAPYHTITIAVSIGVHFKAQWVTSGTNPPPAPPKLSVLFSPTASWGETPQTYNPPVSLYQHGADDGMGDLEVTAGSPINTGSSSGTNLRTYDSGSGVVEADFSLAANEYFFAPAGATWQIGGHFAAVQDTRGVNITSSQDTTFHRPLNANASGQYVPVPNIPDAGGVIHADLKTAAPQSAWYTGIPIVIVTFHGNTFGGWHPNSQYHWYESQTGASASGSFDQNNPVPDFGITWTRDQAPPGTQSHAFISCIDSADGARATGNYYINWHKIYENWTPTKDIMHPLSPVLANQGDWSVATTINCPDSVVNTTKLGYKWTHKITEKATVGTELSAGSEGALAVKDNASIEVGKEDSVEVSAEYTFTGLAYAKIVWYIGQVWEDMAGTCSTWDSSHGYAGDASWTGIRAYNAFGTDYVITDRYPH